MLDEGPGNDGWLRAGSRVFDRYDVRGRLGAGGMGVVYECLDRLSGEHVALKTLRRGTADPQLIKREFRAIADLAHPNLVQLYDLFEDHGMMCLTMELVRGVDLLTELRGAELARHTLTLAAARAAAPAPEPHRTLTAVPEAWRSVDPPTPTTGPPPSTDAVVTTPIVATTPTAMPGASWPPMSWPPPDLERVRDRFAQLARGLRALHTRGIVHRDIKPHNVRITDEGRVVLLDFGLAVPRGDAGAMAGTLAYMAPEQADAAPVQPSADWYSLGVLLHEVLTGELPWPGDGHALLHRKRSEGAPSLRGRPGVPDDLAGLVERLVVVDATARWDGEQVLDALGRRRTPRQLVRSDGPSGDDLVGRTQELAELSVSWWRAARGGASWVAVEGASGVGKTTLLDALVGVARSAGGVALRGRCYERESVAYKGIDQVVEALVAQLASEGTVPEAADLAHAFPPARLLVAGSRPPVWASDSSVATEPRVNAGGAERRPPYNDPGGVGRTTGPPVVPDGAGAAGRRDDASGRPGHGLDGERATGVRIDRERHERREDAPSGERLGHDRRGAALRALIARAARRGPVLIAIDDVQWADRDCLALCAHALAPPGIERVMFVVGARPDATARWHELPMPFVRVRLDPLGQSDAAQLVVRLLRRAGAAVPGIDTGALAAASGGVPLEIVERVRAALSGAAPASPEGARALVIARTAHAPADVREVVGYAVVAGAPIPLAAIAEAGAFDERALAAALDRAQLAGLVRSRRTGARIVVEPAHDHVREVLFAAMPPGDRSRYAAALAGVLERLDHEAAAVAELHVMAGRPAEGLRCADRAALRMTSLGGHDAAAGLWARAATLAPDAAHRRTAQRRRADALALAGRGSEAADLYLALADGWTANGPQAAGGDRVRDPRRADDAAARAERARDLRHAAEELLRVGRFADGIAAIERADPAWRPTRNPVLAMARGLAMHAATRAAVRANKVHLLARPIRREALAEELELVDLRGAATAGYTLGSPGHFLLAVEEYLRAALALGEPERLSVAWSTVATLAGFMGGVRFADDCLMRASALLVGVDAPRAQVVVGATAALLQLNEGAWTRVESLVAEVVAIADRRAPNLVWERYTANISAAVARFHRGDIGGLARDVRRDRERIAARGHLYAHELVHSAFTVVADLCAGDAAAASATLEALDARPTGVLTAWLRTIGHALVGIHGERTAFHLRRVRELMVTLATVPVLRSPILLGTIAWTRAAIELAGGRTPDAARWIARLERSPMRGMRAIGRLLTGHAALLAGDRAAARTHGAAAEIALTAEDMAMFAASARWLVDPASWPAWRDQLAKAGAIRPDAIARLFAPALS